jgi:hypothetical protein
MSTEEKGTPTTWNKATRLAVAGVIAPVLRSSTDVALRRVGKLDAKGNVVGYTTLGEVQKALLLERQIELSTADGVRPKEVMCRNCGKDVSVLAKGTPPLVCREGCDHTCATSKCRRKVKPEVAHAAALAFVKRGEKVPTYCPRCHEKRKPKSEWKCSHCRSARHTWPRCPDNPDNRRRAVPTCLCGKKCPSVYPSAKQRGEAYRCRSCVAKANALRRKASPR